MIYFLLLLHFLSDFLFQTREMAENKSSKWEPLFVHMTIIMLVFWIPLSYMFPEEMALITWKFAAVNAIIHGVQDKFIWNLYKFSVMERGGDKSFEYWKDSWFYSTIGLDQMLHIGVMFYLFERIVGF